MASKKKVNAATPKDDAAKAAKRAARKEALKNRPAGQRTNSKQMDVIEIEGAGKVLNFASPVRKHGCLITSVAINAAGEIVSTSVALVEGVTVKTKKGHGFLKDGVPGMGKASKAKGQEEEEGDEEDED